MGIDMITFDVLTRSLGEKACEFLLKIMAMEGISKYDEVNIAVWRRLYCRFFADSVLSCERQVEILCRLPDDMEMYRLRKKEMLESVSHRNEPCDSAAWWSVSTTNSCSGYRLVIGLKNGGCRYWQDSRHKIGCMNCGYFSGTAQGREVGARDILKQLEDVLCLADKYDYDGVEFLNDGSFLNNDEIIPYARRLLLDRVAKLERVKSVVIECRPEYATQEAVERVLECLRDDQRLDIVFGLETTDAFVSNFCINKGYGREEFEGAVELISSVNQRYDNRVGVFVYGLVKPAYMTEEEAILDMVKCGKYINGLSKRYPFPVYIKLEPSVCPRGTLLEVLFEEGRYFPPSYWSVVEIMARLYEANAIYDLRVGLREDMDDFVDIPGVYYRCGMLSQYDFIIYDAVQRFNKHQNIVEMLAEIEVALEDKTLSEWMSECNVIEPAFLRLYDEYEGDIRNFKMRDEYRRRSVFLESLFTALDEVEYGEGIQRMARERWAKDTQRYRDEIECEVRRIVVSHIPETCVVVKWAEVMSSGLRLLRLKINVNHEGYNYGMWIGIPTVRRVRLDEVKGISVGVEE